MNASYQYVNLTQTYDILVVNMLTFEVHYNYFAFNSGYKMWMQFCCLFLFYCFVLSGFYCDFIGIFLYSIQNITYTCFCLRTNIKLMSIFSMVLRPTHYYLYSLLLWAKYFVQILSWMLMLLERKYSAV